MILRWLWKTFFSRRYSKRLEQMNLDIMEIGKLKDGEPNSLSDFQVQIDESFFLESPFNLNTVNTKTFILMLAGAQPRSFISGGFVQLEKVLRDLNKREFHHLYPKKILRGSAANKEIGCLANFAIISRADNNKIGGKTPSGYKDLMQGDVDEILSHALCPKSLFADDFNAFLIERSELLVLKASELISQ